MLRSWCIYKKIHYMSLTLGSMSHKMLPMQYSPHHMTNATAKFGFATSNSLGEYAFTRKYIFWTWPRGQGHMNVTQYPLHYAIYKPAKMKLLRARAMEEMHLQENALFYIWSWPRGPGHIRCCLYPLHHLTDAPAKFEVAMFYGFGGDAFTRKNIFLPWHWGQDHRKYC